MFPGKTRNIDEDTGKPITQPANMKIGHHYKGKVEGRGGNNRSSYFSKAEYLAAKPGDVYKDPKKFTLKVSHPETDVTWKNAKVVTHVKKGNLAAYENMPENRNEEKKYKDDEGGVISGPPNIKCQPMKKGVVPSNIKRLGQNSSLFHAVHDHVHNNVADNYDRPKEILQEELAYHKEKVGERPPFSQAAGGRAKIGKKLFNFGSINHPD